MDPFPKYEPDSKWWPLEDAIQWIAKRIQQRGRAESDALFESIGFLKEEIEEGTLEAFGIVDAGEPGRISAFSLKNTDWVPLWDAEDDFSDR